MFLYVSRQSAAEPTEPKTVTSLMQVWRGLLRRHSKKIHSIQRGNDVRPIAAELAMEIDGGIPFVSQDGEYGVNMLLGR